VELYVETLYIFMVWYLRKEALSTH